MTSESEHEEQPLRFPLQDVYKFDARRVLAGRITAGSLKVGDQVIFSPSNKTAVVQTVEAFNIESPPTQVHAGQSVGITLDEQIFVERGEIVSHESSIPLVSTSFRANLFWIFPSFLQDIYFFCIFLMVDVLISSWPWPMTWPWPGHGQ